MDRTVSTGEDSGKASDWSIADQCGYHDRAEGIWKVPLTDFNKPLIAIRGTAKTLVITPPNTQDPPRTGPSGGSEREPRDPVPLQLALWTDAPGYRAGETVRLYRSLDPHEDRARYRTFVYLERAVGEEGEEAEERSYLSPLSAAAELHADPVNDRGMPEDLAKAWLLTPADRELIFEGPVPEPGLWQFVLELQPGGPGEQDRGFEEPLQTRRAWAKFVVAERSQLLNRRGFNREVKTELDPDCRRDLLLAAPAVRARRGHAGDRARHVRAGLGAADRDHRRAGRKDRCRGHPRGPGGADLLRARRTAPAGLLGRPAPARPGPGDPPGGHRAGCAAHRASGLRGNPGRGLLRRTALRARGVRRGRRRAGGRRGRDRPVRGRQRDGPGPRPGPPGPRRRLRLPRRRGRLRPLRRQRDGRGRPGLGPRLARGRRAPVRPARLRGRRWPRRRH